MGVRLWQWMGVLREEKQDEWSLLWTVGMTTGEWGDLSEAHQLQSKQPVQLARPGSVSRWLQSRGPGGAMALVT